MGLYWSTGGRRIATYLEKIGIEPSVEDAFQIEIAVSHFYPNHIIGVMEQVLSGKLDRIGRAQDQGWGYFDRPVYSMLKGRKGAHRGIPVNEIEGPLADNALAVFKHAQAGLLICDMDEDEAGLLLYEIPPLVPSRDVLLDAIKICADRDARSTRYLHGILKRRKQEKVGRTAKQRVTNEPWEPPEDYKPIGAAQRAQLEYQWKKDSQKNIEIMRKLRGM